MPLDRDKRKQNAWMSFKFELLVVAVDEPIRIAIFLFSFCVEVKMDFL